MINLVWLKRDLRLNDHAPIQAALDSPLPCILCYIHEKTLEENVHYDRRHFVFIKESIEDLNAVLSSSEKRVQVFIGEVEKVLEFIHHTHAINAIYSYEEIGITLTWERDKRIKKWLNEKDIVWKEFPMDGVQRGRKNREEWLGSFFDEIQNPTYTDLSKVKTKLVHTIKDDWETFQSTFSEYHERQKGGSRQAYQILSSFLNHRSKNYFSSISKPWESRDYCSRISPYLAWGCISLKEVWSYTQSQANTQNGSKKTKQFFLNRVRWRAHFMQKFEMETDMELRAVNRGYEALSFSTNPEFIRAWEWGETGYPLVDACMRCVKATGYLNFRMRAMVVSFFVHHLWQDWRKGAPILARYFLDFEPGIHYPQFQMQTGLTGVNTIRVYNPTKQAQDHDPEAKFIKKWVPELRSVPSRLAIEPWKMSVMEMMMYECTLGNDYPYPIVDILKSGTFARKQLWEARNNPEIKRESDRIVKTHTIPGSRRT